MISNYYLEIVQHRKSIEHRSLEEPIIQLNNEIEQHMQNIFDKKIQDELKDLDDNEIIIFNMFIEVSKEPYKHSILESETYSCLYSLERKKLITLLFEEKKLSLFNDIKSFSLTNYAKKQFHYFSEEMLQRETITIDLTKVKSNTKGGTRS